MHILEPGDSLDSSSSLVSANGKFTLSFHRYDDAASLSYLVSKYNASHDYAWVANRYTPVLYPFGILTLDRNNTLKITQKDGDPVVLYSADSGTIIGDVVATLMDDGNFVLQELSSDGSAKRVLWQSFDYPGDVLLPGMKLGVNRSTGHNWSLSCWLTEKSAVPGPFTLDWDPDGKELQIRRRGVVYWSSGVFRDGSLENIKQKRYKFSIVSNENEDYFSYSAVDRNARPEWLLTTIGRLYDFDGSMDIAKADSCYGYSTDGGCQIWDQPTECRRFGDVFEQENGYFNPTGSSGASVTSTSDSNTSLSISDCKAACWADCNCRGFIFLNANQTGCRYWTGNLKFIADSAGYSSSVVYFLTKKSASSRSRKWIWTGAAIVTALLVMVLCILCCLLRRKLILSGENKRKIDEQKLLRLRGSDISTDVHGIQHDGSMGHDLRAFSYESVMAATDNFSLQNKLGEGGFGPVYKGKMPTGQVIAVKTLSSCSGQGEVEFKNELILISELQHTNLVQLFGFCIHGKERMLIYEYMPNKGLDCILFDSTRCMLLDWKKRFNIIEGIAQGLLYLHKYSRLKVIHRDLKASNILLDENMNPKISDFGTARSFMLNEVEANTGRIVGTHGYMSPEYAMQGIFSGKSDVFSFGVLMLEIISGRRNNRFHNAHRALNLVGYAWELWQEGAGLELMDRNRRYINRKGPLIVYCSEGAKLVNSFRNIPGVDIINVERLNLLKLAPGGHLGRFVIWTKSAFEKLDSIYGSFDKASEKKKGYVLPRAKMVNADLARIINSDEVQSVVRPIKKDVKRAPLKKNPLKNLNTMLRLNPYAKTAKRMALLAEEQRLKSKKEKLEQKRKVTKEEATKIKAAGKAWYQTMISDSDYTEFDVFQKWLGVSQ